MLVNVPFWLVNASRRTNDGIHLIEEAIMTSLNGPAERGAP
ncbi:hypothetical protein [Nonomuraea sp. NPDC050202]|jgi:hypothetical protein